MMELIWSFVFHFVISSGIGFVVAFVAAKIMQ